MLSRKPPHRLKISCSGTRHRGDNPCGLVRPGLGAVLAALGGFVGLGDGADHRRRGGQIGPYLEILAALRNSGERVVIDGPCLSACTLVLGVIPRDRICVTARARLGFHAAWHPGENGRAVTQPRRNHSC